MWVGYLQDIRLYFKRISGYQEIISVETLELTDTFKTIMHEATQDVHQKHPLDSFKRIFWEQQVKTLKQNKRQVRWHPMFIKWCLSLKLLSSATYSALRSANVIALPSERTLRDYTHYIKAQSGFNHDLDADLMREAGIKLMSFKKAKS